MPWPRLRGPDDARRETRGGNTGRLDDDGVGAGVEHAGRARGCAASLPRGTGKGPGSDRHVIASQIESEFGAILYFFERRFREAGER